MTRSFLVAQIEWEYKTHPRCAEILNKKINELYKDLWTGTIDTKQVLLDSRIFHEQIFQELTPHNYKYFAGHFRGESFPQLKNYHVSIQGDPTVGIHPQLVQKAMSTYSAITDRGLKTLDALHQNGDCSLGERLRKAVTFACDIFVFFLGIHPYANGNGHIGRLLLVSALKRYGYEIKRWPIDPRPSDPPYTPFIINYRQGNKEPFIFWVLQNIQIF